MHEMCVSHLREAIRILEPTVIVAQGWTKTGHSPSQSVARALRVPLPDRGTCTVVDVEHGRLAFVAVVHPSRTWAGPTKRFFDEVEPALRVARQVALGC
jgi:uracil-DNA glycosylase